MSYSTYKGWEGQEEFKDFLEETFSEWGYRFANVTGSEKNKKVAAGDVIPIGEASRSCILRNYFLEAKKRGVVQVFDEMAKAEDDARGWGKWGAIGFFIRQKRGHKGERLVCMTPQTFKKLIQDLQRSLLIKS